MGLIGEAAVMADLSEGPGGADDEVAGFLNAQVAQVFLRGHVKAGFEFSKKTADRKISSFREFDDSDVVAIVLMEELQGGTEFFVFTERGGALIEGAADADDATNFVVGIEEGLFSGGGPVDEPAAAGNEFDPVDDGLAGFKNPEIIFADVFQDMLRDEVIVPLSEDVGGLENLAKLFVERNIAKVTIFDEVDESREVVEDGCEVILDVMIFEELGVLHRPA